MRQAYEGKKGKRRTHDLIAEKCDGITECERGVNTADEDGGCELIDLKFAEIRMQIASAANLAEVSPIIPISHSQVRDSWLAFGRDSRSEREGGGLKAKTKSNEHRAADAEQRSFSPRANRYMANRLHKALATSTKVVNRALTVTRISPLSYGAGAPARACRSGKRRHQANPPALKTAQIDFRGRGMDPKITRNPNRDTDGPIRNETTWIIHSTSYSPSGEKTKMFSWIEPVKSTNEERRTEKELMGESLGEKSHITEMEKGHPFHDIPLPFYLNRHVLSRANMSKVPKSYSRQGGRKIERVEGGRKRTRIRPRRNRPPASAGAEAPGGESPEWSPRNEAARLPGTASVTRHSRLARRHAAAPTANINGQNGVWGFCLTMNGKERGRTSESLDA
ncbi:hypothetical protein DBV15_04234 [Temnothorax longispinosus]|uniref:Uncharacterized protein n=1 Tax=Temnothorax longispinosus TaxID=300112 RepID=A0A4S2KLB5_9HYME|nr:hypothetical protein DBV15_04234 [Temnothorax longispinosus]